MSDWRKPVGANCNQQGNDQNIKDMYHVMYVPRGMERLENLGELIKVPKNTDLNEIDTVPPYCYIVKSGRVLCYEISYAGAQRVYNFMEPGSILLEECLLFDQPCPVLFRTLVDSELIRIEKCRLKGAFKRDVDVVMDVCQSLSMKFLSSMEHLRLGPHQSASWKLCKLLLIFAENSGTAYDGKVLIKERLSQQMLADLLGLHRVTVTRNLKILKEDGLLEQINGYYCIRSLDQLKNHMAQLEEELE